MPEATVTPRQLLEAGTCPRAVRSRHLALGVSLMFLTGILSVALHSFLHLLEHGILLVLLTLAALACILTIWIVWQGHFRKTLVSRIYGELINQLPIGIYEADAQGAGTIRMANDPLARMLGAEKASALQGRSMLDLYWNPSRRSGFLAKINRSGSVYREEIPMRTLDGRKIWISVTARLIRPKLGQGGLCVGTIEDITARKAAESSADKARSELRKKSLDLTKRTRMLEKARLALLNIIKDLDAKKKQVVLAQQELAGLNETLEAKVAQRTAEVNKLLAEKESFVRRLGHDLKTPLTPMVALMPGLLGRLCDDEAREILGVLIDNVEYMWKLVESTLELARLGCGAQPLKRTGIDLAEVVVAAVAPMRRSMADAQIEMDLQIDKPLLVQADAMAMREVVQNLLENARKYMGGPGRVEIRGRLHAGQVRLSVRDTGLGIETESLGRVFDEFYKADPSRHDRASTGLGLSICRRIMQQLDGQIWVESEGAGKGSIFTLVLEADCPETDVSNRPEPADLAMEC